MRRIRMISIRIKVIAIVLFITLFTVSIGFGLVIVNYIQSSKHEMLEGSMLSSKMVSQYCASPLIFDDSDGASAVLEKLATDPAIIQAVLRDYDGKVFATYNPFHKKAKLGPDIDEGHFRFSGQTLQINQTVSFQGERKGSICIRFSTAKLQTKIYDFLKFMVFLIGFIIVVTFVLANWMQKLITQPVEKISTFFLNIAEGKQEIHEEFTLDSSLEFMKLIDAINIMTSRLDKRLKQLKTLQQLSDTLILNSTPEELYTHLHQILEKYLGKHLFCVATLEHDGGIISKNCCSSNQEGHNYEQNSGLEQLLRGVVQYGQGVFMADSGRGDGYAGLVSGIVQQLPSCSIIAQPLFVSQESVGAVGVMSFKPDTYSEEHIQTMVILASQLSISIENRNIHDNLEYLVGERTAEVELANRQIQQQQEQLVLSARESGMMEMSSGIIHNIGNAINSMGLRLEKLISTSKNDLDRPVHFLENRIIPLIQDHLSKGTLQTFLAKDPQGVKILYAFGEVFQNMHLLHHQFNEDLSFIDNQLVHISEIISLQQNFVGALGTEDYVDFNSVIRESLNMWRDSLHKRNIGVVLNLRSNLTVLADRSQFIQIFINFIKNSMEAIEEKNESDGIIRISTENMDCEGKNSIKILCWDNGCGIPEERMNTLFQFGMSSKKKKKGGQGFGLFFCKKIVDKYSGELSVRSVKGEFTEFQIILKKAKPIN